MQMAVVVYDYHMHINNKTGRLADDEQCCPSQKSLESSMWLLPSHSARVDVEANEAILYFMPEEITNKNFTN